MPRGPPGTDLENRVQDLTGNGVAALLDAACAHSLKTVLPACGRAAAVHRLTTPTPPQESAR
ncbi:hypothetical protein [Streptomyces cremeus]|uniref:Uncharacterized protein n=1 Tax=Streptomyces cremeus TaxID=66881 RepID=A0ABV5P5I3_STRCM